MTGSACDAYWLIGALALVTYGTRIGGYLVLSRFHHLNPRVEAALDVIPIAVITSILAPIAFATGIAEFVGVLVAAVVSARFPRPVGHSAVPCLGTVR